MPGESDFYQAKKQDQKIEILVAPFNNHQILIFIIRHKFIFEYWNKMDKSEQHFHKICEHLLQIVGPSTFRFHKTDLVL